MCKIPRTSSTLCQHLINAEWQILPLRFGADHVCTTEILRTKLELINKRTPCWRVHHQHRLQAGRQPGLFPAPKTQLIHVRASLIRFRSASLQNDSSLMSPNSPRKSLQPRLTILYTLGVISPCAGAFPDSTVSEDVICQGSFPKGRTTEQAILFGDKKRCEHNVCLAARKQALSLFILHCLCQKGEN